MFDKYKQRYKKGWATKEQLLRLVALGILSKEEYNLIINSND